MSRSLVTKHEQGDGAAGNGRRVRWPLRPHSERAQLECRLTWRMEILIEAGCPTKYEVSAVLDLLRNRLDLLVRHLGADPMLMHRRFPELTFGNTVERRLTLRGATLLHVAAEYGNVEAANLLLDRGADVNARATIDDTGIGGQTPIFHAVTQFYDWGLAVTRLLLDRGADLSV
ncbi:MAG: ankyrin repeat domain-containing protein [Candidatus Sulfotelmatobacter sp.]